MPPLGLLGSPELIRIGLFFQAVLKPFTNVTTDERNAALGVDEPEPEGGEGEEIPFADFVEA